MSMTWSRFTTLGAMTSMLTGTIVSLVLILLSPTVWVDLFKNAEPIISLKNPGIFSVPAAFIVGVAVSLLKPEPASVQGFRAAQDRMHLGPR
jgi:cation/acetate symporter